MKVIFAFVAALLLSACAEMVPLGVAAHLGDVVRSAESGEPTKLEQQYQKLCARIGGTWTPGGDDVCPDGDWGKLFG